MQGPVFDLAKSQQLGQLCGCPLGVEVRDIGTAELLGRVRLRSELEVLDD